MPPLVSILIPAYNSEKWIADSLHSAIRQTYNNIEIILIDDGSTDNTLKVAQSISSEDKGKILVVSQKNKGVCAARNHAFSLSKGDFIQYLDADDLLDQRKIELQIQAVSKLNSSPNLTLLNGLWGRFTKIEETVWAQNEAVYKAKTGVEFLQIKFETHSMIANSAWLTPRLLCKMAGPWDESLTRDTDGEYFARVATYADSLQFIPQARSYYRSEITNSISRGRSAHSLASLYRATSMATRYLLDADLSSRSQRAAAIAWRRLAFELYPEASELAHAARQAARSLSTEGDTPIGGPSWVGSIARLIGWRNARRLHLLRNRFG